MQARVPVSIGELLDKISILRIKSQRIEDPDKLTNVRHELTVLDAEVQKLGLAAAELQLWLGELDEVNGRLWQIEDDIRACEARGDFGAEFVDLARSVYRTNDVRAQIKRRINEATGSDLVEEKSYVDPDGGASS